MSRFKNLLGLYERWRRLTELEGEGIRLADWSKVAGCQETKEALQEQILDATRAWRAQAGLEKTNRNELERALKNLVDHLLALERQNREWLQMQREAARVQKPELEKTSRNLHQVQKAYVSGPQPL